jgi:ABC-type branched-subunit amino acid transport system substrate-binding protein
MRRLLRATPATRVVALVAVTAAVIAACSSSSSTGSGGSPPAFIKAGPTAGPGTGWSDGGYKTDVASLKCGQTPSDPTRGITDTSITIGGLAYLTSPNGSSMAGTNEGAKARFERANAEGGVNGRKINFIGTLDDGQDPSRNSQQAQVLVDQKKVFAAVPVMSSNTNYLDTFCQKTVPFFGWGFNTAYCGNVLGFGITGCQFAAGGVTQNSFADEIKSMFGGVEGKHTIAFIGIDNDSARAGITALSQAASAAGLDVVYDKSPVPLAGVVDATPIVNAVMTSNNGGPPDVVFHVTDLQSIIKIASGLKGAGFTGKQISPIYDPRLAGVKDLEGLYSNVPWMPAVDGTYAPNKQMIDDVNKYAPGTALGLATMAGYWAADMFINAAQKTGRDLNLNTLLKTLNGGDFSNYVPDVLGQSRWPLNHLVGTPCTSTVLQKDSKLSIVQKLNCGSVLVPTS